MKSEAIIYAAAGLLLGILIAWSVSLYAVNGNHSRVMRYMGMHQDYDDMPHNMSNCTSASCSIPR